jgi:hypothetical protein
MKTTTNWSEAGLARLAAAVVKKPAHTPGPWEVDDSDYRTTDGGLCVMAGNLCVAVIGSDSDKPQAENARLISAAPELLEVLYAARQWLNGDKWRYDEDPIRRECWQVQVDAMDAAIAKATGSAS